MGLASKLAASQAAAAGGAPGGAPPAQGGYAPPPQQQQQGQYGAPPPQQQQQQGQYGQPPPSYGAPSGPPPIPGDRPGQQHTPQPSYGAPPGQPPQQQNQYGAPPGQPPAGGQYGQPGGQQGQQQYGQPPQQQGQYGQPSQQQGQYGQPPQQQQGAYGAPPGAPPAGQYGQPQGGAPPASQAAPGQALDPRMVEQVLQGCVVEQKLTAFYPPGSLGPIAQRVAQSGAVHEIASSWKIDKEIAMDIMKLALFDTILLIDDSGSMAFEEGGERIDDLKLILGRVAYATSKFDSDGIQVRFLNSQTEGNGIRTEQDAVRLVEQVRFSGLTPLGTALDNKVLQPLVLGPARAGRLQKPVLIITITDGTPAGEPHDQVFRSIINANNELSRTRYGGDAVSYQFAQVGNDLKARDFLSEIDSHPQVGGLVDCTSNYESEADEMKRKAGIDLTPELWLVKMLAGGIDDSYDEKDEAGARR